MTTAKPDQKTTALLIRSAVKNNRAVEAQKKKLLEYVQEKGIKKYKFYIDNGFSGLSTDRPALLQLMSDIRDGKIGTIVVTDIARLIRDYTKMATLKKEFNEFGVSLITLDDDSAQENDSALDMSLMQRLNKALEPNGDLREYSVCEDCHQEKAPNKGCLVRKLTINGKVYKRIPAGYAKEPNKYYEGRLCHDCNVSYGQYHHPGCDCEQCPVCHEQLISCDCEVKVD